MLSKLDTFLVDPVYLQREKRNTKTSIGGVFTILLAISCILSFILLFLYNENKKDIQTVELLSSKNTITSGLTFQIQWEPEVIDVDSIEIVTQSGKNTDCYRSRTPMKSNSSVDLCPFGTDLYSEQNGVGFVFTYNKTFPQKAILPIEPMDMLLYTIENEYAYVVHPLRNEFCVYTLQEFTHNCVPFKYKSFYNKDAYYFNFKVNYFVVNDTTYFSIYDNINTIYLFKYNTIVNTYTYSPFFSGKVFFITHTSTLSLLNDTIYNITDINTGNTLLSYQAPFGYMLAITTDYIIYNDVITTFCNKTIKLGNIHTYTYSIGYSEINIDYTTGNVFLNNSKFLFHYSNVNNTDIITKMQGVYMFIFFENIGDSNITIPYIIIHMGTFEVKLNKLDIIKPAKNIRTGFKRWFEYASNTIGYIIVDKDTPHVYDTYLLSVDNTIVHIHRFNFVKSVEDIGQTIININKVSNDTYMLYVMKPFALNENNIAFNTGGFLKCKLEDCRPVYTTLSNLYTNDGEFNPKIATVYYDNFKHPIYLNDVTLPVSLKSEIMINTFIYSKSVNNIYGDSISVKSQELKRLYTVKTTSVTTLNFTENPNTNYYIFDNTNTGHDNKFICYHSDNDIVYEHEILFNSLTFLENRKNCVITSYDNIPFLFQNVYGIRYIDNRVSFKQKNNNTIGMFLLNIDDTIRKTTITPTKSSPFSVLGSIGGLFSTLITLFAFLKNTWWKYEHRSEIYEFTQRMKEEQINIEIHQVQKINELIDKNINTTNVECQHTHN